MNDIRTWAQGRFVDQKQYPNWTDKEKARAQADEEHLVRPGPTSNAICHCPDPRDAKWIAQRLNLASKLEEMAYDYATGKSDGSDIVRLVRENVDA